MTMPQDFSNLTDEQKVAMNLITINTAINKLQEDMDGLRKVVLLGNGELPLREQVRNHETFIKDLKYWVRYIGGALVIQTVAFLAGIVIAVVRFLPVLERLANQP